MAPSSLIRYIFRHGPHTKARVSAAPPPEPTKVAKATEAAPDPPNGLHSYRELPHSHDPPDSPLAYKSRSDSRQSSILEDIAEEGSSNSSSEGDVESVSETVIAPALDIRGYTTQELLAGTLSEAKIAIHSHLDTINTTLELLGALEGFSATIAVLRDEMLVRKEECEEKLDMLEDVEEAVATT